jgi:hypothetical protein
MFFASRPFFMENLPFLYGFFMVFIPGFRVLCQNEGSVPECIRDGSGEQRVKVAISFVAGVIVCGLMLIGVRTVLPSSAETVIDPATDNTSNAFLDMLPDIEKIYRESLLMPFQKAAAKIYDEDIAEYYRHLMDATGLSEPIEEPPNP